MNDLTPLFTSSRARSESSAPAPERKATESNGADFARSLASVRGMARSAAAQDRPASARSVARGDDREVPQAHDAATPVRSRAQVQALMLSGAMKFAATRSTDAATAPAITQPATSGAMVPGAFVADTEPSVDVIADAELPLMAVMADVRAAGASVDIAAAPALAPSIAPSIAPTTDTMTNEPLVTSELDASIVVSSDQSASAAATLAAMQLVATLPMADAAAAERAGDDLPTASTPENNDDAARAAWMQRMNATQADDAMLLVEDHFDAPAMAAGIPNGVASAAALRDAVPANVTLTVANADADAAAAAAPVTITKPAVVRAGTHGVERDVAQLTPEFRERLQRVIDRMKQEFGHDVTVVETVRSQARQAALYAQGRTAPGPVVTWTRNSKHSKGLAADLMVDGQWNNPAGYAHLAQIAKQEGLRTLGARDPGHVELPADGSVSSDTLDALLGDLAGDAGDSARKVQAEVELSGRERDAGAMARVADVAQVARVSQVAQVARVASVARPGDAPARSERGADALSPLAVSGPLPQFVTDGAASAQLAAPVSNVNMADRISHLMDLQATQSARPLNSVLLRMDNANGIEDQIRIDTRGTSVDAQLGLGSAQQAAELSGRVSELREALERRGLTADGVRVQAAPRASDSVNFSRMTAPAIEVAAMRAGADAQAQGNPRDQTSRDQQQREALAREQERHTPRSSPDDARHRSRREQPETRQ